MNERYTFAFRASIFLALLSAYTVFAGGSGSGNGRDLGLIAVMYVAATYWRDWRFKTFDLRSDLAFERIKRERPLFFVFGSVVESQAPEKKEKDVLLDTDLRKYRMHSVVAYWFMVGAIGFMIQQRTNAFPFSLPLILTFLMISPLASASHLSHFLFPVGLSVLGVVVTSFRNEDVFFGPVVLFTFSVFSALCFYQLLKVTYFERAVDRRDHLFATLKRATVAALGFIIIVGIISKVFPKSEPIPQFAESPVKEKKPSRLAREIARRIVDLDEYALNRKASRANEPASGGEGKRTQKDSTAGKSKLSDIPNLNLKGGKDQSLASEKRDSYGPDQLPKGGYGPNESETRPQRGSRSSDTQQTQADAKALEDLQKRLNDESSSHTSDRTTSSQQDLEKLRDQLQHPEGNQQQGTAREGQGHDPKALAKLMEQEGKQLLREGSKALNAGDGGERGAPSQKNEGPGAERIKEGAQEKAEASVGDKNKPSVAKSEIAKDNEKSEEEKSKKVEALEKKIETVMTMFEKHSRFIMTVIIAGVLIVLFSKYLASLKPKPRSLTLSQKEKQALADQLRELQKLKLTPQQEVIETYNVVMEILDRVELGREEGIPARIHMESLSRRLPRLGEPFISATDCFDHALYGEIAPDSKELIEFRQSTKKIFRQFDIAA